MALRSTAQHSPLMALLPWYQRVPCSMESSIVMKTLKDGQMKAQSAWTMSRPLTRRSSLLPAATSRLTTSNLTTMTTRPRLNPLPLLFLCQRTDGSQSPAKSFCKFWPTESQSWSWDCSFCQSRVKKVSVNIKYSAHTVSEHNDDNVMLKPMWTRENKG